MLIPYAVRNRHFTLEQKSLHLRPHHSDIDKLWLLKYYNDTTVYAVQRERGGKRWGRQRALFTFRGNAC